METFSYFFLHVLDCLGPAQSTLQGFFHSVSHSPSLALSVTPTAF